MMDQGRVRFPGGGGSESADDTAGAEMLIKLRSVTVAMAVAWLAVLVRPVLGDGNGLVSGVGLKIQPPLPV
ncbi:MAG: hypothetical protein ACUVXJ_16155 [Phycisphaerae bacterium]